MSNVSNVFMQVDGVKGTVTDKKYKEWIAIDYAATGAHNYVSADNKGQLTSRNVHIDAFGISKKTDATSTQIFSMITQGTIIKKVIIAFNLKIGDKDNEIYRWELEDCMFTSCVTRADDSGGVPSENITLEFSTIKIQTNLIDSSGSVSKQGPVGWDRRTNTKL